jgi:hypothetical protein
MPGGQRNDGHEGADAALREAADDRKLIRVLFCLGRLIHEVPFTVDRNGHEPACALSLFEGHAEFGFGLALRVEMPGLDPPLGIMSVSSLTRRQVVSMMKHTESFERA